MEIFGKLGTELNVFFSLGKLIAGFVVKSRCEV